jgi:DNA-binding MarR family transcriptional regulator
MSVTLLDGVNSLTAEIRAAFHDLSSLADNLHAGEGVTASMRAVMEFIAENDAHTVPAIARAKSVSRQHIQQLADALVSAGQCEYLPNPAHKRSPLLALTEKGRGTFARMRERERETVAARAASLDPKALFVAAETIAQLRTALLAKDRSE